MRIDIDDELVIAGLIVTIIGGTIILKKLERDIKLIKRKDVKK